MSNETFFDKLANRIKNNENPSDLKPCIIGKVVKLEPITVQIECERILLTEGDELIVSEWFTFRKNIDKTSALSNVPNKLTTALSSGACTAPGCTISTVLSNICTEIKNINAELKQLKLDLQLNDLVLIGSLEETDKYILIDKV